MGTDSAGRPARLRRILTARTLLLGGALLILMLAGYHAAVLAWSDHLSRSQDLADRERAARLWPTARTYERLADKREEEGQDSLPDLRRAVEADPENPVRLMRLAVRAEFDGDLDLAERSLLRAASLSCLYQPKYLLAQYYFRRKNADLFWRWWQSAQDSAFGDVTPLLELAWHMQPQPERIAVLGRSARPEIRRQYISYLTQKKHATAAYPLARYLAEAATREDLPTLLRYCDERLAEGSAGEPLDLWNVLSRRGLVSGELLDPQTGKSLTNGNFQHAPMPGGFEWHVNTAPGLDATTFENELRIAFDGNEADGTLIAWKYVPLIPSRRYRLQFMVRAVDARTADGLDFYVYDPATKNIAMSRTGDQLRIFTAPTEVVRIALIYNRPHGSTRLRGTVAISGVELEMLP